MLTYAGVEHWLIENCQLTCAACVRSVGKPEHPEETTHTLNCANHYIIMPPYLPFDFSRWTSSQSTGPSPGVISLLVWRCPHDRSSRRPRERLKRLVRLIHNNTTQRERKATSLVREHPKRLTTSWSIRGSQSFWVTMSLTGVADDRGRGQRCWCVWSTITQLRRNRRIKVLRRNTKVVIKEFSPWPLGGS